LIGKGQAIKIKEIQADPKGTKEGESKFEPSLPLSFSSLCQLFLLYCCVVRPSSHAESPPPITPMGRLRNAGRAPSHVAHALIPVKSKTKQNTTQKKK
jgi:hypothetical protein